MHGIIKFDGINATIGDVIGKLGVPEPFGPTYPAIPGATKFRKIPRDQLTADQRREYSALIVGKILSLQRADATRTLPAVKPRCASGTWANNADGAVGAAVREQQARALANCPDAIRRARTPAQWQELYEEAMRAKRKTAP
jgi:hypothetical protein